jgi:phage repressor protein C with HTH and peptisase S24 domain
MAVLTFRRGECTFLQIALPGRIPQNAGVLLLDSETDTLHLRVRRDWEEIAEPDDAEVLALLDRDLRQKATEMGGARLLEFLEEHASNLIRVTPREAVQTGDFEARLNRLYRENIPVAVRPFVTHLPRYSFRAAAGSFGEEMTIEAEQWVEAPEDVRLTPDMFVGRVVGKSMEPRIPDGSLCVFRRNVVGSRQGKLLLIENFSLPEGGGRYTVKRYKSEKAASEEGWHHQRITLEPLNPDYDPWDLSEGEFRVLGEFVRVLPPDE